MYELVYDSEYLAKTPRSLTAYHRALRESAELTNAVWASLENSYTLTGELSPELMALLSASIKATIKLIDVASEIRSNPTTEHIPF